MKNAVSRCVIQCLALNGARLLPSPVYYKQQLVHADVENTKKQLLWDHFQALVF
jgi:hypothetical protein